MSITSFGVRRVIDRFYVFGIVLCLLLPVARGAAGPNYNFSTITAADGLCNDYIRCLFQDRTGFVWIGTYDGLSRYDGHSFVNFRRDFGNAGSLPSNTIFSIAQDKYGILWIATGKGVCYYDQRSRSIHRMQVFPKDSFFYSYNIRVPGGTDLLLTSQTGLYRYRITGPGKIRLHARYGFPRLPGTSFYEKIFIDPRGNIFVLTAGALFRLKDEKLERIRLAQGGEEPEVGSIACDRHDNYWLTYASENELLQFDRSFRPVARYPVPAAVCSPDDRISGVQCYDHGILPGPQLLCGSNRSGLILFSLNDHQFRNARHDPAGNRSLSGDQVNCSLGSADGMIWVGTDYGLCKFDPAEQQLQMATVPLPFSSADRITVTLPAREATGSLWLGTTANGVILYNFTAARTGHYRLPGPQSKVQCLFIDGSGDLYAGTEGALYRMKRNESGFTRVHFRGVEPYSISSILELSPGRLLIGSFENGCFLYEPATGNSRRFTEEQGLFCKRCTNLSRSGNQVYITHISNGISALNTDDLSLRACNLQPLLDKELGYTASFTYCSLPQGDSLLWIGTGLGLVRYDVKKQRGYLVRATTRLKTDNEIWTIIPGPYPLLWLKTTYGIYGFNQSDNTVLSFQELVRKGVPAQEGYFRMQPWNNRFVIPGQRELYLFDTSVRHGTPPSSAVTLLQMKVEGKDVYFDPDAPELNVILKPGENSLELGFTAIGFRATEFTSYSYRLKGVSERWSGLGDRNSLYFPNLKAGRYELTLKAANAQGKETYRPLLLHIDVRPLFWQTPWFYLLIFLVFTAGLYGLYQYRLRQLLAMQQVRQKISRDLHDDIGATVSSIGILAGMAGNQQASEEKKSQLIHSIAEESKYVAGMINDIVWTINPRNDNIEMILARLHRYASELFEACNIHYEINMPQDTGVYSMKMADRQNFYLIFKEAINNLTKYSGASHAVISVHIEHRMMHVVIRDNGVGFVSSREQQGNGLYNMKKRAGEMQAALQIESAPGKGTEISMRVALK